jgi:hypothetical protein
MAMFLSGPPGGQTLPQTATRLSDLDGGVFGLVRNSDWDCALDDTLKVR